MFQSERRTDGQHSSGPQMSSPSSPLHMACVPVTSTSDMNLQIAHKPGWIDPAFCAA